MRPRGRSGSARALLALAGCTLASGACGDGDVRAPPQAGTAPTKPAARHQLCAPLRATGAARIRSPAALELSGLALSGSGARRTLWTHNDSGDRPRVLALSARGRLLADVAVGGAEHVDWEDIAIGPAPGGGSALYVADIGDNAERRASVVVYRVPEPVPGTTATAPAARLELRYPDGAHDAEALLVDPRGGGALVIVTKTFDGDAQVFSARRPSAARPTTLRRAGAVTLAAGEAVTAGSVSAGGETIALRTYGGAYVWARRGRQTIAQALRAEPCAADVDLLREGQGEALALVAGGGAFYTVAEGPQPILRRYALR